MCHTLVSIIFGTAIPFSAYAFVQYHLLSNMPKSLSSSCHDGQCESQNHDTTVLVGVTKIHGGNV